MDDDPALGRLFARRLQKVGYVVSTATEALEALARLEAAPKGFDALVTDHRMPGMTGLDLARKAREVCPWLVVLLVTGAPASIAPDALVRAGIARLLSKPCDVTELARVLSETLGPRGRACSERPVRLSSAAPGP